MYYFQAGSALARPEKSEQTKQYAASLDTLYSKLGNSLHQAAQNLHCLEHFSSSFFLGNEESCGWHGPSDIKYFF